MACHSQAQGDVHLPEQPASAVTTKLISVHNIMQSVATFSANVPFEAL
jgi:hypothetical protein